MNQPGRKKQKQKNNVVVQKDNGVREHRAPFLMAVACLAKRRNTKVLGEGGPCELRWYKKRKRKKKKKKEE